MHMKVRLSDWKTGQHPVDVGCTSEPNNSGAGLSISCAGYGLQNMQAGYGDILYLEVNEGTLRLLVWADINQEEPTHIIDLSAALETNRKESP